MENHHLGGGFKYFLFSPLFGEHFQFASYFSDGLKPPTRKSSSNQHLLGILFFTFSKHLQQIHVLSPGNPWFLRHRRWRRFNKTPREYPSVRTPGVIGIGWLEPGNGSVKQ